MRKTAPVSVRLPETLSRQVTEVAAALGRPRSWVIERAVRDYVTMQLWQLAAIDEGIRVADADEVAAHEDVVKWARSWDSTDELPPPGRIL